MQEEPLLPPAWIVPDFADYLIHRRAARFDPGGWQPWLLRPRLPGGYLASVGSAVIALIAAPYAEELWRCARHRGGRR